jgi:hypothetical protein
LATIRIKRRTRNQGEFNPTRLQATLLGGNHQNQLVSALWQHNIAPKTGDNCPGPFAPADVPSNVHKSLSPVWRDI